jgi:uncharacterized protein YfaA (DUF2138 family)
MGSATDHANLVLSYEAWDAAERAARLCPQIQAQQEKADRLHAHLTQLAFRCGYEPGREHRHLLVTEFAAQKAAATRRFLPLHVKEARS